MRDWMFNMERFKTWFPELSSLTLEQRAKYEFNRDYATVISDVTSFDHVFLRKFLESHWKTAMLSGALGPRRVSEAEALGLLDAHYALRETMVSKTETESKRIYLWPRGKVPAVTEYTENTDFQYADMPGFEPYMLEMLVDGDVEVKGALILCAGGGHMYRSNIEETYEVALEFNKLGYQCFIVNYRVNPYIDEESALDVARAIRYVRFHSRKYGIEQNGIAVAGFSWGGIVGGLTADRFGGSVTAKDFIASYVPDELDTVSSDINVNLYIYSAVPEEIQNDKFPPTFLCWGLADELIQKMADRSYFDLRRAGIITEVHTFAGVPHAFGAGTDAGGRFYPAAAKWISLADIFMQSVYADKEK